MPEREIKCQLLDRFGGLKDLAAAYLNRLDNAVYDGKITAEEKEVRENAFLEVMKMTLRVFSSESQHALGLEGCPDNWILCCDGSCVQSAEDCLGVPTPPI